jgi:hypothetical protein
MTTMSKNFQDGFEYRFEYPGKLTVDGETFVGWPIVAFIEPDESVGCTDWYIANIYIDIDERPELVKNELQTSAVIDFAYATQTPAMHIKWREWLDDRPKRRA